MNNKEIFSRAIYRAESLSAEQDSNLHPSVSGQVHLPLDHLHSRFSLLFNSYPRASIVPDPRDLDTSTCALHA